jgi:hypothetical protein
LRKNAPPFKKYVFSIDHLRVCFFCLFLISIDFRVLFGAPLVQNGSKKLQQMNHLAYFWTLFGPTRPTEAATRHVRDPLVDRSFSYFKICNFHKWVPNMTCRGFNKTCSGPTYRQELLLFQILQFPQVGPEHVLPRLRQDTFGIHLWTEGFSEIDVYTWSVCNKRKFGVLNSMENPTQINAKSKLEEATAKSSKHVVVFAVVVTVSVFVTTSSDFVPSIFFCDHTIQQSTITPARRNARKRLNPHVAACHRACLDALWVPCLHLPFCMCLLHSTFCTPPCSHPSVGFLLCFFLKNVF